MSAIDNISIAVARYAPSRDFYDAVLATLGLSRVMEITDAPGWIGCGYGSEGQPQFWIGAGKDDARSAPVPPQGQHIAFAAPNRAAVDAFHSTALAHGASDNGAPGPRPHYHASYYGAFVIDADGNHLEAVCHRPE